MPANNKKGKDSGDDSVPLKKVGRVTSGKLDD